MYYVTFSFFMWNAYNECNEYFHFGSCFMFKMLYCISVKSDVRVLHQKLSDEFHCNQYMPNSHYLSYSCGQTCNNQIMVFWKVVLYLWSPGCVPTFQRSMLSSSCSSTMNLKQL